MVPAWFKVKQSAKLNKLYDTRHTKEGNGLYSRYIAKITYFIIFNNRIIYFAKNEANHFNHMANGIFVVL